MLQIKINRIAESVDKRVNTPITLGMKNNNAAPLNMHMPDNRRPCNGILNVDSLPNARGAEFSLASPNSILLVENTPLFADERAEVSTTKLTIAAAAGKPARENSPTKGLLSGEIFCQDETDMMQASEST